jgi:hypothetical protein
MFALYYEKGFTKILIQKSYDKNYLEKRAELLRKGIYIGDVIPSLCLSITTSLMGVIGNYIVEPFKEQ